MLSSSSDRIATRGRWGLLLEAGIVLALASVLTRTMQFKTYISKASIPLRKNPKSNGKAEAMLVDALAERVPFRAVCLQRGLTLQWILRRRGINAILHYGIKMLPQDLEAHVWVSVDGEVLIGAPQHETFAEVAHWPSDP